MRIAIVAEVYLPKIDGVVIRTMNLIRELQNSGNEVLVLCPQVIGERHSPVPVVDFASFPFPMYPEYRIGCPDHRLVEAIQQFQPDVIHFLNPFAFGFRCYDRLTDAGVKTPTLFSFHTLYPEFVKRYGLLKPLSNLLWRLTRHYHNCADLNLTVSDVTRLELSDRGFKRVRLWQPAIDTQLFCPKRRSLKMRSRLVGENPGHSLLLTVSRLAPEKNVEFLREVLEKIPDASLAIVGDGPHRQALERHFKGMPVNFIGYLQGEQLAEAYASANCFIYASETETMGNVVLEAMASGTPVVAARSGGVQSLTTHNENGLLFSPGDATTAASFVKRVLVDKERRQKLTVNARDFALQHGWPEAAAQVRSDYQAAIEQQLALAPPEKSGKRAASSLKARVTARALVGAFRWTSRFVRSHGQTKVAAVSVAPAELTEIFSSTHTPLHDQQGTLAVTGQHEEVSPMASENNSLVTNC